MKEEINFAQLAITNGFVAFPKYFNPKNNWFGCSTYHPDFELTKGNKKIVMSLNGITMPMLYFVKHKELLLNRACKYLAFKIDDKVVYETFTGELPDNEFMSEFILTASDTK